MFFLYLENKESLIKLLFKGVRSLENQFQIIAL